MTRQFPDEQVACDFVDTHRDELVVVRYRDDKPGVSILLVSDRSPGWALKVGPGVLAQVWQHVCNEVRLERTRDDPETKSTLNVLRAAGLAV